MTYTESDWNGYRRLDFTLSGRAAILILPKEPDAQGRWLLKTEYFDAFPDFELRMLAQGWHVAYLANSTRWHKPEDDGAKEVLCVFLQAEFGLSDRCVPVGMSCGGMHAVYFAARYPERVAGLYLDAPVLNLLSCPCGVGAGTREMYEEFVRDTGMTVSDLINYRQHPIDQTDILLHHQIPVFLVAGDSDTVVPYGENGAELKRRYEAAGAPLTEVLKPGCDHHPHGLADPVPLMAFAEAAYARKTK